jgi:hypothetical protein
VLRRIKPRASGVSLEERVRRDLGFLFSEHGATVTSNTAQAFGTSELTLDVRNVAFKFTKNKRDADYRVVVAPRNADGVWELLHVALAAATGDDAKSLIVPVFYDYDDEPSQFSYVGLTRVAEILRPRFVRLDSAFDPQNYPATYWRMVQIERLVHPR